jgi:AcrR family transcriptional regulator
MPSPATALPELPPERFARLRVALIDLSYERGFQTLGEEEVCERAGLDLATFHRYYLDLPDCFFHVYRAELRRYQAEAEAARRQAPDWRGRLRATAYALYRFLAGDQKLRHFNVVEVRGADERTQLLLGAEIEQILDLLDEGRADPDAPDSLTRATAESLGGGIFNELYATAGEGHQMPPESEIVPQMMYMAVLPYLGPEAAAEELEIPPPPRSGAAAPPTSRE